jgi:hypothetical protein
MNQKFNDADKKVLINEFLKVHFDKCLVITALSYSKHNILYFLYYFNYLFPYFRDKPKDKHIIFLNMASHLNFQHNRIFSENTSPGFISHQFKYVTSTTTPSAYLHNNSSRSTSN